MLAFAQSHRKTEAEHLALIEQWLPPNRRSLLLGPWLLIWCESRANWYTVLYRLVGVQKKNRCAFKGLQRLKAVCNGGAGGN